MILKDEIQSLLSIDDRIKKAIDNQSTLSVEERALLLKAETQLNEFWDTLCDLDDNEGLYLVRLIEL